MTVLYTKMGLKIHKTSSKNIGQSRPESQKGQQNTKSILNMLAVVVFSFFLCWAPFHTQRLLYVVHFKYRLHLMTDEVFYAVNEKLFYITGIFLYLSSTINPIIYNLMSVKYRKAFKSTFLCFWTEASRSSEWPTSSLRSSTSVRSRTTRQT